MIWAIPTVVEGYLTIQRKMFTNMMIVYRWIGLQGPVFFIRSEDFHDFGGFDKEFFAHMEEIDLCWRLRLSGKRIFYNGGIKVFHVNGGTLPTNSPFKTYLNFRTFCC